MTSAPRWRRFDEWDSRPLRHDQFAVEDPEAGFRHLPQPVGSRRRPHGSRTAAWSRSTAKPEAEFDILDSFIAAHHLDLDVVDEAMAMDPAEVARMLVDINVPRETLERLARGMTPAKLVSVVSQMSSLEITFAYSKMRQRRTPGNQAHVTNAKDDPLQLAADAAVAVALGFDEIETTMRVASNGWANAMACAVGAAVGRGGVLFQCSIEEAEELRIGMAGFTSYAETVSVYGTEARLRRRRRHALVEGFPDCRLRLARDQGALHLGRLRGAADGLPRAAVGALPRGAMPVPAARHGRAGYPERRHRWRAPDGLDGRRHARADGREPHRRMARSGMRVRKRHARQRIRNPGRRQDHALPDGRLRLALLRLRLDPRNTTTRSIPRCSTARTSKISCRCSAISRPMAG